MYLGAIISLISGGAEALNGQTRSALVVALILPPQTQYRWRLWWSKQVPVSDCWRALSGWFSPPISLECLPAEFAGPFARY